MKGFYPSFFLFLLYIFDIQQILICVQKFYIAFPRADFMALPNIGLDWNKDDEHEEKGNNQSDNQAIPPEKKSLLPKFEFKIADKPKSDLSPKEKKENKSSSVKKVIVWFTIIILAGSTIGYFGLSQLTDGASATQPNQFKVGNTVFYALEDNTFGTLIKNSNNQDIPILFRLDPRNAENIPMQEIAVQHILNYKKVYLAFSPNADEFPKYVVAATEVARITSLYGLETITAFTEDAEPVQLDVPIKDCDAVGLGVAVVKFQLGETGVTVEDGCVLVSGKTPDDIVSAADKLGYNLVGIKI